MKQVIFKFCYLMLFAFVFTACVGIGPEPASVSNLSVNNSQKYANAHAVFIFKDGEMGIGAGDGEVLDTKIVNEVNKNLKGLEIFGNELEVSIKIVDYSNFALVGDSKFTTKVEVFDKNKIKIGEFKIDTILYQEIGLKIGISVTANKIIKTLRENFIDRSK